MIDSFVKTLKQIKKTSSRIFENNSSRNLFISSNINTFFRFHQILISNTWFLCNERFSSIHSEIKLHRIPALFLFFLFFFCSIQHLYISSNVTIDSWLTLKIPRHIKMKRSSSNCRHCQYRNTIENTQSLSVRAFKGNPSRYNLQ